MREIIFRSYSDPIHWNEAALVIEEYIRVRKGVSIKLAPFSPFEFLRADLFFKALNHATEWFRNNEDKIP